MSEEAQKRSRKTFDEIEGTSDTRKSKASADSEKQGSYGPEHAVYAAEKYPVMLASNESASKFLTSSYI